jgi:hypothetical protein
LDETPASYEEGKYLADYSLVQYYLVNLMPKNQNGLTGEPVQPALTAQHREQQRLLSAEP